MPCKIVSGDFYQLPPVSLAWAGFAFQSSAWAAAAVATPTFCVQPAGIDDERAIGAYKRDLQTFPGNIWSLTGLRRCYAARADLLSRGSVPSRLSSAPRTPGPT